MPAEKTYAPGMFCYVDLNAHDRNGARDFYSQLFGWSASELDTQGGPPYTGLFLGDRFIGGVGEMSDEMKGQGIPPMWNCYVNVEDCSGTERKANELGGKTAVPTTRILDAGHLAFIVDPAGAMIGLWQANQTKGSQAWGEINAPCWCEGATRDIEGSKQFYESLFGWQCNEFPGTPSKYYVANVGDAMTGGLMEMTKEWGELPSHWSVYFQVDDVDATVARCEELGGKACFPAFDSAVGRIAGCSDPQGAFFYLIRMNAG